MKKNSLIENNQIEEDDIEIIEEITVCYDIITSFETRGWALYQYPANIETFSIQNLQSIVEFSGRVKSTEILNTNGCYFLLPLIEKDTNFELIKKLLEKIIKEGRGPYYIDLEEHLSDEGRWPDPIGRFWIDHIIYEPPELQLIFDRRLSNRKDGAPIVNGSAISIGFWELHKIRKQLMMCTREDLQPKKKQNIFNKKIEKKNETRKWN